MRWAVMVAGRSLGVQSTAIAASHYEMCLAVSPLVIGMLDSIAGDNVAEPLPSLAVEFHELHLFDRKKVVWTRIDLDAGQQHVA